MRVFGEKLREKRKEKGMTQQAIAAQLDIHRTTYVRYEQGDVEPSLEILCRLADLLEITTDALLGRE